MGIIKQVEQELEQAREELGQLDYECMKLQEQHYVLKQEGKSAEARNVSDLYDSKRALSTSVKEKIEDLLYKLGKVGSHGLYNKRFIEIDNRKRLRADWNAKQKALEKAKRDYERFVEETNNDILEIEEQLKQTDDGLRELMGVDEWAKMF